MTKTNKKILCGILGLIFSICAFLSLITFVKPERETYADTMPAESFRMLEGASVRLNSQTGIRFTAQISNDFYDGCISGGSYRISGAYFGMIIIPNSYYLAYQDSAYTDLYAYLEAEKKMKDIHYSVEQIAFDSDSGNYLINGSIVGIYLQNYVRDFIGIGYYYDGTTRVYAQSATGDGIYTPRSIVNVASRAIASGNYDDNPTQLETLNEYVNNAKYSEQGVFYSSSTNKYTYGGNSYDSLAALRAANPAVDAAKSETAISKLGFYDIKTRQLVISDEIADTIYSIRVNGSPISYVETQKTIVDGSVNNTAYILGEKDGALFPNRGNYTLTIETATTVYTQTVYAADKDIMSAEFGNRFYYMGSNNLSTIESTDAYAHSGNNSVKITGPAGTRGYLQYDRYYDVDFSSVAKVSYWVMVNNIKLSDTAKSSLPAGAFSLLIRQPDGSFTSAATSQAFTSGVWYNIQIPISVTGLYTFSNLEEGTNLYQDLRFYLTSFTSDYTFDLYLDDVEFLNEVETTLDLSNRRIVVDDTISTVSSVKIAGNSVEYTYSAGVITLSSVSDYTAGSVYSMVLLTDKGEYVYSLTAWTQLISNSSELSTLLTAWLSGTTDGYYALDADIDASGISCNSSSGAFNGVFDGLGHAIYGLAGNTNGIIKTVNGTIRNTAFIKCTAVRSLFYELNGKIENCFFDMVVNTSWNYYGIAAKLTNGTGSQVKNCVMNVEITGSVSRQAGGTLNNANGGALGTSCQDNNVISNVYIINRSAYADFIGKDTSLGRNVLSDYTNVSGYNYVYEFFNDSPSFADASWSEYWDINEEGALCFGGKVVLCEDNALDLTDKTVKTYNYDSVSGVKINGTSVDFSYSDGIITLAAASYTAGTNALLEYTADGEKYTYVIGIWNLVVSDAAEFTTLCDKLNGSSTSASGYYCLDRDIDASSVSTGSTGLEFTGTINGFGHTVDGLNAAGGVGLVKEIKSSGIIRDISFTNGIATRVFLVYQMSGTLVNVYVQATVTSSWRWYGACGTYRADGSYPVVHNCLFNITNTKADGGNYGGAMGALYAGASETITNTYVINNSSALGIPAFGSSTGAVTDITAYTNSASYNSANACVTSATFSYLNGWHTLFKKSGDSLYVDGNCVGTAYYTSAESESATAYLSLSDKAVKVENFDDITGVTVDSSAVDYTYSDGIITLNSIDGYSSGSSYTLVVSANGTAYTYNLKAYDGVVYDRSSLAAFITKLKSGTTSGYYVITEDIDASGISCGNSGGTFSGTLDGLGHTIAGLDTSNNGAYGAANTNGFVKTLTGTIKNVAFTDVIGSRSIIAYAMNGTCQNVYVQGSVRAEYGYSGVFGKISKDGDSTILNCVFDIYMYGSVSDENVGVMGYRDNAATIKDIYIINRNSDNYLDIGSSGGTVKLSDYKTCYSYSSVSDFISEKITFPSHRNWSVYWNVNEGGDLQFGDNVIYSEFDFFYDGLTMRIGAWNEPANITVSEYMNMKALGINRVFLVRQHTEEEIFRILDICDGLGIEVIVSAVCNSNILYNKSLLNYRSFKGVLIQDEPNYNEIAALANKISWFEQLFGTDKLFYVNLFNDPTGSADKLNGHTYQEYVTHFCNTVLASVNGNRVLSFDIYPVLSQNGTRKIMMNYIDNLAIIAYAAKAVNASSHVFIQTMAWNGTTINRVMPTEGELRLQVYAAMAFGFKSFSCFCYLPAESISSDKKALSNDSDLQTWLTGIEDMLNTYDDLYLDFKWYYSMAVKGSSGNCTDDIVQYIMNAGHNNSNELSGIVSVSSAYDTVMGRFISEYHDGTKIAYMVTNLDVNNNNTITITFSGTVTSVTIYCSGTPETRTVTGNTLELTLEEGMGAFVVIN